METISLSKKDPNFKYEVASFPGAENLRMCFSCGTCTAGCPVFRVETEYNPRKIIRMILLGLRKEVLSSRMIWLCARCYACTANCPQGVNFADIMAVLQEMAVREGYAPSGLSEKIKQITEAAHVFRKECINLATGVDGITKEKMVAEIKKAVKDF